MAEISNQSRDKVSHTPGPWIYQRLDEWTHTVVTRHEDLPDGSPSHWAIASINKRREPEHEANARLIAAAPELLAALKLVVERASDEIPPWIDIYAAIEKAEGR